jgi:hypothetical protein
MAFGITDRVWSVGEQFFAMGVFAGSPRLLLMLPLNRTLWMLLVASLVALAGWGVVYVSGRLERRRKSRLTGGMTQDSSSRSRLDK